MHRTRTTDEEGQQINGDQMDVDESDGDGKIEASRLEDQANTEGNMAVAVGTLQDDNNDDIPTVFCQYR